MQRTRGRWAATRVQFVGGEEDRDAVTVEVHEEMEDIVARLDVHTAGWFVEEQEARVADERAGEEDALLLTAGEVPDMLLAEGAMPSRSSSSIIWRRSAFRGHGQMPESIALPMRTTSSTVTGKFQSMVSS